MDPAERCDYQCTEPDLQHFPRNIRQHLPGENGVVPDLPVALPCCMGDSCCMSESMVAASPACVPGSFASGFGAVGNLHTCGADAKMSSGCNNVYNVNGVPNVYSAGEVQKAELA